MADGMFCLNDEAVALIGAQEYKPAASLLRGSISKLRQAYGCSLGIIIANGEEVLPDQIVTFWPTPGKVECHDEPSSFEIYRNTMTCAPGQHGGPNNIPAGHFNLFEEDYVLLLTVLLYNYGLCLHLGGLSTGCERDLHESAITYEMALGLLASLVEDDEPCTMLLELALLNNIGHIKHRFLDTAQEHACLQRIRFILYGVTHAWTKEVPHELSPFAHNVLYNGGHPATKPAPAA